MVLRVMWTGKCQSMVSDRKQAFSTEHHEVAGNGERKAGKVGISDHGL